LLICGGTFNFLTLIGISAYLYQIERRDTIMAETVHLYLKANGEDIQGESTQTSLERENSIECLSFIDSVRTARERGSGVATGRRTYEPIMIRKRIDKSSPLLAKALCANEVIDGVFKFFRPNPSGDGTTEQFFTVEIAEGRVNSIERVSPDVIDPAAAAEPPTEEVSFVFHTITWTYEDGGQTHTDNWREGE
jgi:type VI secretion system secreted protein Hcp